MFFYRLKELRLENNQTQMDVAKILNVCQSPYSRWESGKEIIPLPKLFLLTEYYNVSLDYITNTEKNKNNQSVINLNKEIIGKNLRKLRKMKNITQIEMAIFLNTTQSTVSAIENGKNLILTQYLIKITRKHKLSIDEFLI